MGELLESIF
jgi:hypothetical protein